MTNRPSVASATAFAKRSAPTPWPGKFFGHVVTMRHSVLACAMAGLGNVAVPAAAPAVATPARNWRRLIFIRFAPLGCPISDCFSAGVSRIAEYVFVAVVRQRSSYVRGSVLIRERKALFDAAAPNFRIRPGP